MKNLPWLQNREKFILNLENLKTKMETDSRRDVYIQLLELAREDLNKPEGITYDEFISRLGSFGIKQHPEVLYRKIYDAGGKSHAHMGIDAYMMLIEYEELRHSLEESRQARREAKWAIWIASGAIIVQIALWLIDKT
jgi:hypothetical protein